MVSFVRTPSPPVRQLKIRPRPSSCFDLHKESTGNNWKLSCSFFSQVYNVRFIQNLFLEIRQQQKENRWSKVVDEHREEHFEYNYNYNYNKTPERIVPSNRHYYYFFPE